MVVWLGAGRKELGVWSNRNVSLGRPLVRKPGSSREIIMGDQWQWCWLRAEARAVG